MAHLTSSSDRQFLYGVDEFIAVNAHLRDSRIMLTHYSAELLFSPQARTSFVEPDLGPIPSHD